MSLLEKEKLRLHSSPPSMTSVPELLLVRLLSENSYRVSFRMLIRTKTWARVPPLDVSGWHAFLGPVIALECNLNPHFSAFLFSLRHSKTSLKLFITANSQTPPFLSPPPVRVKLSKQLTLDSLFSSCFPLSYPPCFSSPSPEAFLPYFGRTPLLFLACLPFSAS